MIEVRHSTPQRTMNMRAHSHARRDPAGLFNEELGGKSLWDWLVLLAVPLVLASLAQLIS